MRKMTRLSHPLAPSICCHLHGFGDVRFPLVAFTLKLREWSLIENGQRVVALVEQLARPGLMPLLLLSQLRRSHLIEVDREGWQDIVAVVVVASSQP